MQNANAGCGVGLSKTN